MDALPQADTILRHSEAVQACCDALSRLALGEQMSDEDSWAWTRRAIRLVRNTDHHSTQRIVSLFEAACVSSQTAMQCRLYALRANCSYQSADYSAGLEHALAGRALALSLGLEREASLCSALAGALAQRMGRYSEASDWFDESVVSARRAKDRVQEAGAFSNAALLAMLRGNPESALEQIDRAVGIYEDLALGEPLARCLLNRGIFLGKIGRFDSARKDLEKALTVFEGAGLSAYSNSAKLFLARINRIQGHDATAIALLDEVSATATRSYDPRKFIIRLEYLGDYYADAGRLSDALEVYREAHETASGSGEDSDLAIESSYRLGLALVRTGNPLDGLALLTDAVNRAKRIGDAFEIVAALLAYGLALQDCEDSSAAKILEQCVDLAGRIGDVWSRAHATLALSRLRFSRGESLEALALASDSKSQFLRLGSARWVSESDAHLQELSVSFATNIYSATRRARTTRTIRVEGLEHFLTGDTRICDLLRATLKLAPRSLSILILGESGTGKELIAEGIHNHSGRPGVYVPVNCGALPGDLLEAELFGHARGAYTGADRERGGLIEHSDRGTLFLDEIGDMPLKAQARLLRALERGEVRRLGENSPRLVDLRIVAATHRNLLQMVSAGEFRLDLYHRLTGFTITIPPLRERVGDIDLLIDHFLAVYMKEQDKVIELADAARAELNRHAWPGNVRQLRNVIHRLVSLSEPGQLVTRLPFELEGAETPRSLPEALDAEERRRILAALESARWNKAKAARTLGSSRTTLIAKMKRLGIEPPETGARVR